MPNIYGRRRRKEEREGEEKGRRKRRRQAGAELGQAQLKLGLDFN